MLKALRQRARYQILTPIALLAASLSAPALAATVTVSSPTSDYVISAGDSLVNNSTITGATQAAVSSSSSIDTITNNASGRILGGAHDGIEVNGTAAAVNNAGFISATTGLGVDVTGDLNSFANTGTVNSSYTSLYVGGSLGSFNNSGSINSVDDYGVYVNGGDVTSFVNSGTIQSDDAALYVYDGGLGTFNNSGTMTADDSYGVYVGSGDVGSFTNSGTIQGEDGALLVDDGTMASFNNSGTMTSSDSYGVYVDGTVGNFTNSGTINGYDGALYIASGDLTSFNNSGTMESTDSYGVYVESGNVGSFTNSGTIESYDGGLYVSSGTLGTFNNSGTIRAYESEGVYVDGSVGTFTNSGTIDAYDYGVEIYGSVGTFQNSGTIKGRFESGVYVEYSVGTFANSGTITSGESYGVYIGDGVTSFTNSGTIHNYYYEDEAVYIGETVGTFTNSGLIESNGSQAVYFDGAVGTFSNSGSIVATADTAVYFNSSVDSFNNSGTITGAADEYGVYVSGTVGSFTNSGKISGDTGVYFSSSNPVNLVNSGTIVGTGGTAVVFGSGDDTLTLKTGAAFVGGINFGGGNDMLDISGYHGSLTLEEGGTLPNGNVIAGSNLYAQSATEVAIVSTSSIQNAAVPITDLVSGLSDLIDTETDNFAPRTDEVPVSNYAPKARQTPAEKATDVALTAPIVATGPKAFAEAIGGGSITDGNTAHDAYGALVAGTFAELTPGFTAGVLAGVARSGQSLDSGAQTITSVTGLLGAYGQTDLGPAALMFDVIGGITGNSSDRTVSTGFGNETASASFGGWFVAPEIGALVPVMTIANGQIGIEGKVGYIAGGLSGYTETGSTQDMTVSAQTIGVLNTSFDLNAKMLVSPATSDTPIYVKGKVGVFTQTNVGNSSVSITLPDFNGGTSLGTIAANTGTVFGVKAGLSVDMPLAANASLSGGINGALRNDGQLSGSAGVKLSASY
jgi:hypothetical protein